jgi:hypothetical protein
MSDDHLSRYETPCDEPLTLTRYEKIFIYTTLTLCCLIFVSACLYLGYKIGEIL